MIECKNNKIEISRLWLPEILLMPINVFRQIRQIQEDKSIDQPGGCFAALSNTGPHRHRNYASMRFHMIMCMLVPAG